MRQAQTLDGVAFQDAVDGMVAELDRLLPGAERSRMAEDLIRLLLGRRGNWGSKPAERYLDRLTHIGDENSPERPGWQRIRAAGRLVALMGAVGRRELIDYRAAMHEADRLAKEFAGEPEIRGMAVMVQACLAQAADPNDVATVHEALAEMTSLLGSDPEAAPLVELAAGLIPAVQASVGDGGAALASYLAVVERFQDQPGSAAADVAVQVAPVLELLLSLVAGVPDSDLDIHDHRLDVLQVLAERPGIAAPERAHYLGLRGGVTLRQGIEQDPDRLSAAIADLRTAVAQISEKHPDHVTKLVWLAWALSRRAEVTGRTDDVDEAIRVLERARQLARDADHPDWSAVNEMLAQLGRRNGGTPQSRLIALEGLRGHARQVLLQPDPISARVVARTASESATLIATQLLSDDLPVDALRALDAGRGLMLFAATELRDPGTRLIEAGRPDLAERWQAEHKPSPALRQDVVEVLAREAGLLDPPDLAEIQAALHTLDADALIYLVPTPLCGWAMIAPAEGEPRYLMLPHLLIEDGTDIERYLAAMATRNGELGAAGQVRDIAEGEFADSIDALCDWAWKAAMGPIVTPYLAAGRVPHLVLVPMGDLARVPWQAARDPDGRYLVERVALSHAASARMLCESAVADPVRLTPAGLVVADPDTGRRAPDIPAARLEAYAIRESFYPGATYLGRLPRGTVSRSGAGTPDEVRGWLRADGAEAGAMLHLASHGFSESAATRASSRLILAGGDLTADELIAVLAGSTPHQIGLVVLAACHSGRSIHGYDEAYSLATMFLATGVRSVLSTQWAVPDSETSLLMYMFHHYLMAERRQPWDALRRAQIWMLDSARTVPARMPEALHRTLQGSDPSRVAAWAGFIHWGQ